MVFDRLSRRMLLTAALALAADPVGAASVEGLSPGETALVARAGEVLEHIAAAQGRFVQTDARGATTSGQLFIQRPGKARFAYDAPSGLVVVADGQTVAISDRRLKTFDRYPLSATPLALFLARRIKLDRSVAVTRASLTEAGFQVTAKDRGGKTHGEITLIFSSAPDALIGWTLQDAQGATTRVRLLDLRPAAGLDPGLFKIVDPHPQGGARPM